MRYPADIEVGTRTARLGGKSMTAEAAVFVQGTEAAVATSSAVVVWFDYEKQATVQIPDPMRDRIRAFEVVRPS